MHSNNCVMLWHMLLAALIDVDRCLPKSKPVCKICYIIQKSRLQALEDMKILAAPQEHKVDSSM